MCKTFKCFKVVIYNLLFFLIFFVVLELLVRIMAGDRINYQGSTGHMHKDSVYFDTHGLIPNSCGWSFGAKVSVNSLGLRGDEITLISSKKNILLLGDSILFGVGVPDSCTIAAYLQKTVSDCCYQTLNCGVIGYGLYDYLNVLKVWINKIKVDRVVLFYVLNDLYRVHCNDQKAVKLQDHRKFKLVEGILNYLRTHSKFYLWLKNGILDRARIYYQFDYKMYHEDTTRVAQGIDIIKKMHWMCQNHSATFNIFMLPYRYQYKSESIEKPWLPQDEIVHLLSGLCIRCSDLRFIFADSSDIDTYYLYGDAMHFSKKGTKRIGQAVGEFLVKQYEFIEKVRY
jgi:hypothetical protein